MSNYLLNPFYCDEGQPLDAERVIRALGGSRKLVGFRYTAYMVEQVKQNPDCLLLITKRLYPETAQHFDVPASSVERGVRTLIHICWERADRSLFEYIAGTKLDRMPTNSEFIDMLAEFLKRMN